MYFFRSLHPNISNVSILHTVMKIRFISFVFLISSVLTACIQDEPLNPEADILSFGFPGGVEIGEPIFNQDVITVMVRKNVDISHLKPVISITPGATIVPDTALYQNFTDPVTYTVTSEDGKSQRMYNVQVLSSSLYRYGFNRWVKASGANYEMPVEYGTDGSEQYPWSSSNVGVNVYQQFSSPDLYPVHPTEVAYEGKYAAEMRTQAGPGKIFNILNIPVVAGSLFTGTMDLRNVMKDPLTATQFGLPFNEKPVRFRGWYTYKVGKGEYIYPEGKQPHSNKDFCAVYSVFYKVDETTKVLDGTNILSHKNIVAIAMLNDKEPTPGNDFKEFDIAFDYSVSDHVVDFEKNDYKLAIIFSSSFYGDYYEGVLGSTLVVDDVVIEIEENQ